MRKYIDIITEAIKPTKTQDKTSDKVQFADPDDVKPIATRDTGSKTNLPGKTADKTSASRQVSTHARLTPAGMRALADLNHSDIDDEISDEEARRNAGYEPTGAIEPTPENLPAVIRKDLVVHGQEEFDPKWIQVKHLPGYMQQAIRGLGRRIFRQFTDTPIEDIQVLSTLSNPESDVRKMMAFISRRGIKDDEANMDFNQIMPGVDADVQLWRMQGYEFLLVKDMMGYYIYGWPGGRGVHLGRPSEPKKLK